MKQILFITAFLMMMASSEKSGAQTNNDVAYNHYPFTLKEKPISAGKINFKARVKKENVYVLNHFVRSIRIVSEIEVTKVNVKAVRHFIHSYKNVLEAKWFKTEGGFIAIFFSKGTCSKIVYDDKGMWFYNLLTYTEADLDPDIRHRVKSTYYDHDIISVEQFEFYNNKQVYLIRIRDQRSKIVTLKVSDEVMTDITEPEKN